jgi:hypothetical protein
MSDTAVEQQATNFRQRRMTYDLLCVRPLIGCVSQGKDDDEGVHPKHREEPDVKNVGHCFPHKKMWTDRVSYLKNQRIKNKQRKKEELTRN